MRVKVEAKVLMTQIIPNVQKEYREEWKIPEDHQSVGIISCDNEEVMFLALDDATKKANVEVFHASRTYAGATASWSKYGGGNIAMISGPKVQDVKSGLSYAAEYIKRKCGCYKVSEDSDVFYYADWVSRAGKYFQEKYGIPADTAYAYLYSTPVESTYALDFAMKAGDTQLVAMSEIPTRSNTVGAILSGTEAACRSAVEAYANAIERMAARPLELEV